METITNTLLRKILSLDFIDQQTEIVRHQLFPNRSSYNYMMIGPNNSGRTSLLFEFAFQLAENNSNVLFITSRRIEKLPHLIGREQPAMKVLKRIEIKYASTNNDLIKLLSSLHLTEYGYDLIIVDNFDEYFPPSTSKDYQKNVAALSALLIDATSFIRKQGCNATLMCSVTLVTSSLPDQNLINTLRNWFDHFLYFYPSHSEPGFYIKTEFNLLSPQHQIDVDITGIHLTYDKGRIDMK